MENDKTMYNTPLFPVRRPCGAKSRSGHPCKNWSMANGRCRFHGSLSTGPRTERGIEAIRKAHFKHGRYSSTIIKRRFLLTHIRLWLRKYGRPAPRFLVLSYWKSLKEMTWRDFCQERARFMEHCRKRKRKLIKRKI